MKTDEEISSSQIASDLKDWNDELRGINRKLYKAHKKDIAISYGAGHMPDLEKRLRQDLGLVPVEVQWLRAFGVNPARAGLSPSEVELIRDAVRREMLGGK